MIGVQWPRTGLGCDSVCVACGPVRVWILRQRPPGVGMLRELVDGAPIVTAVLAKACRFESRAAAIEVAVGLPSDRVRLAPLEVEVSGPRQFRGRPAGRRVLMGFSDALHRDGGPTVSWQLPVGLISVGLLIYWTLRVREQPHRTTVVATTTNLTRPGTPLARRDSRARAPASMSTIDSCSARSGHGRLWSGRGWRRRSARGVKRRNRGSGRTLAAAWWW